MSSGILSPYCLRVGKRENPATGRPAPILGALLPQRNTVLAVQHLNSSSRCRRLETHENSGPNRNSRHFELHLGRERRFLPATLGHAALAGFGRRRIAPRPCSLSRSTSLVRQGASGVASRRDRAIRLGASRPARLSAGALSPGTVPSVHRALQRDGFRARAAVASTVE